MQWIRAHRYTVALIAFAILVVTGGVVTSNDRGATERGGAENISVEYPYYAPPIEEFGGATKNAREEEQAASSSAPRVLFFGNTVKPREIPAVQATAPAAPEAVGKEPIKIQNTSFDNAYLLFFRTLTSILAPADTRTPEQKALFDYGNTAGAIIKTFEDTHKNVTQTLKTFFDSRIDPSKAASIPEIAGAYAQLTAGSDANSSVSGAAAAAGVRAVADEYMQLSAEIGSMRNVPPAAETLNAKLAKGYADVAQGLSRLSQTETEAQLLDAIQAYNANAGTFVRNYVALVQMFSAYGVKFSANDPGAIFSFSARGF